jgi:hypothetical protein
MQTRESSSPPLPLPSSSPALPCPLDLFIYSELLLGLINGIGLYLIVIFEN